MSDMIQIHQFALKWLARFRDRTNEYTEFVDHYFADDCDKLGFKMDSGKSFKSVYGNAISDPTTFAKIIANVTDIDLLGSVIYSRWRYFNHWALEPEKIIEPANREWFIIVLERLALLTKVTVENNIFQGVPQKIQITSNYSSWNSSSDFNLAATQQLTVSDIGMVVFTEFYLDTDIPNSTQSSDFKIEKNQAHKLLTVFSNYFKQKHHELLATDVGTWDVELTNTEGIVYEYHGSFLDNLETEGINLSDLTREVIGRRDLYVLDGNFEPDLITRITLKYHKVSQILADNTSGQALWSLKPCERFEKVVVDRAAETITHTQKIDTTVNISHKYQIKDGVSNLLDSLKVTRPFSNDQSSSKYLIDPDTESEDYIIVVNYKYQEPFVIKGNYTKDGWPGGLLDFLSAIRQLINSYSSGNLLSSPLAQEIKKIPHDYILLSVSFFNSDQTYYYLTEDDSIEVNDRVIVPVGDDHHEVSVKVVNKEYYDREDMPISLQDVKYIVRKYDDPKIDS